MKTSDNDKRCYAIIGLGKSGMSCLRYLMAQSAIVEVMDTREHPPYLDELRQNFPDVPVHLGGLDANALMRADEIIVSQGYPFNDGSLRDYQQPDTPLIGDIELFARAVGDSKPIVAITGSNGKSTVTTLVGEMAREAGLNVRVGGNLGIPALDLLDDNAAVDLYVLELSNFQLELTYTLQATVGVVLNICNDHLDRYPNLAAYIAAKQRIYQYSRLAVINRDDLKSFTGAELPAQVMSIGLSEPPGDIAQRALTFGLQRHEGQLYLVNNEKRLLPVSQLFDSSDHQVANSLAALALGTAVNLPMKAMLSVLQRFVGLPHRCEKVALTGGVTWYNDSKATNVGAALASISGLGRRQLQSGGQLIVVGGGNAKGADFSPLGEAISAYVSALILLGRDAKIMGDALAKQTTIHYVADIPQAVSFAAKLAKPGDCVLLAPACSSIDGMFKNFEHRGDVFKQAVREISNT